MRRYDSFARDQVHLEAGECKERFQVNRDYLMSLDSEDLLFNYRHEAVLNRRHPDHRVDNKMGRYDTTSLGGWESPASQVRGHFLGHWLSAAARIWAAERDERIKRKADYIVSELARYQEHNGDGWVGSIPQKYFEKMEKGQPAWAPQYVLHKTLMGLWEMYKIAGNQQAFEVLLKAAEWFYRWSGRFNEKEFQRILDGYETGGMLEVWADLYSETKDPKHLELVKRYDRKSLFDGLLHGNDVLSERHANTIIPEIYGAARAYEVTGDDRYRRVVEAFWEQVVPSRMYATGGHTHREVWAYPNRLKDTLLDGISSNQEFCTVYNMMWLAKYLFRWTGDCRYADYYERNFYNGILSGHHVEQGVFTYYHPFKPGSCKRWDSRTEHFWCCFGTGVQSIAEIPNSIYFHRDDELLVNLFVPSTARWQVGDNEIRVTQSTQFPADETTRLEIRAANPAAFKLSLRIPWWVSSGANIRINGNTVSDNLRPSTYWTYSRTWEDGDVVDVTLPMDVYPAPLPDAPNLVAVMYGPLAFAAIAEGDVLVKGDPSNPKTWVMRKEGSQLTFSVIAENGTEVMLRPLYEILNDPYTLYITVR